MSDPKGMLDEDGNVVLTTDLMEWAQWFETADRQVARTEVSDGVAVSTVFLGLSYGSGDHPLWFETMIFGGPHNDEMWRYSTREKAIAGHAKAVELAKS